MSGSAGPTGIADVRRRLDVAFAHLGAAEETLRLDLSVDSEFCSICKKIPTIRLILDVVYGGQAARVSVCRDCLAEYAPELLVEIEKEAGFG